METKPKTKIFVSYKYADAKVYQNDTLRTKNTPWGAYESITPRHYLNALSSILSDIAIQKWEKDGEDLSQFKDETIESKLRDLIYDSSMTIILISPGMNTGERETEQWIPWEISYSLKEIERKDRTSKTNAILAVILPDKNNSYSYCVEKKPCCDLLKFNNPFCFKIIAKNFFNRKDHKGTFCESCNSFHYPADSSYIVYATWDDFKKDPRTYIKTAFEHKQNVDQYNICKAVTD